jgi:hypothetical protein
MFQLDMCKIPQDLSSESIEPQIESSALALNAGCGCGFSSAEQVKQPEMCTPET